MDQDETEQLTERIEEHRRNIEETVQEIEDRISPRQMTRRWVDAGKEAIERLRFEGLEESSAYQNLQSRGEGQTRDAALAARGLIARRPGAVAAAAVAFGFLLGGIGR